MNEAGWDRGVLALERLGHAGLDIAELVNYRG